VVELGTAKTLPPQAPSNQTVTQVPDGLGTEQPVTKILSKGFDRSLWSSV